MTQRGKIHGSGEPSENIARRLGLGLIIRGVRVGSMLSRWGVGVLGGGSRMKICMAEKYAWDKPGREGKNSHIKRRELTSGVEERV